jgi:hypothetical protein
MMWQCRRAVRCSADSTARPLSGPAVFIGENTGRSIAVNICCSMMYRLPVAVLARTITVRARSMASSKSTVMLCHSTYRSCDMGLTVCNDMSQNWWTTAKMPQRELDPFSSRHAKRPSVRFERICPESAFMMVVVLMIVGVSSSGS